MAGMGGNVLINQYKFDEDFYNAILTPENLAKELSLKTETIRELLRSKGLPGVKIGGSWRTTRRALYVYLENKMGMESGPAFQGKENNRQGIFQIQGAGKRLDKGRKAKTQGEPQEIFFSR